MWLVVRSSALLSYHCFLKQKTAYEMRISDWSSDVCSSDLNRACRSIPSTSTTSSSTVPCAASSNKRRSARERAWSPREPLRRSEERRVGKEGVSTCRYQGSP